MEFLSVVLVIISVFFGVLQIILFFKLWNMCDDIAAMHKRFKAVCPTKEESHFVELMAQKQAKVKDDKTSFEVGDRVIYPPMNRRMIIKQITNDGRFVCISFKSDGTEEYEGTYKANQIYFE